MRPKYSMQLACFLAISMLFSAGIVPAAPEGRDSSTPRVVLPEIDTPSKGMSMSEVEKRYGDPEKVIPGVGDPPIVRWVYDRFTVYFEDKWVLHSVVPRSIKLKTIRSRAVNPAPVLDDISEDDETGGSPFD